MALFGDVLPSQCQSRTSAPVQMPLTLMLTLNPNPNPNPLSGEADVRYAIFLVKQVSGADVQTGASSCLWYSEQRTSGPVVVPNVKDHTIRYDTIRCTIYVRLKGDKASLICRTEPIKNSNEEN